MNVETFGVASAWRQRLSIAEELGCMTVQLDEEEAAELLVHQE